MSLKNSQMTRWQLILARFHLRNWATIAQVIVATVASQKPLRIHERNGNFPSDPHDAFVGSHYNRPTMDLRNGGFAQPRHQRVNWAASITRVHVDL
jgi:hypothetical protein